MKTEHPCTHCGLPAPAPQREGAPTFCCHGCAAVYELLQESELGAFYELRERSGEARPLKPVDERSLKAASALYAHLDEPFELNEHTQQAPKEGLCETTLYLEGMHCAACVWVLEKTPERLPGVKVARAHFGDRALSLVWDQRAVKLSEVASELHRLGYQSHELSEDHTLISKRARRASLMRLGVTFAIMGNIMLMAVADYVGQVEPQINELFRWLSLALCTPQVTYGALPFWRGAYQGWRTKTPHMDMPIVVGLSVSYLASAWATVSGRGEVYFDSVATLVFLLLLGRYAQERGQSWASNTASLWRRYAPRVAWRRLSDDELSDLKCTPSEVERDERGGAWVAAPVSELKVGEVVRVQEGEVCPVDGRVRSGRASFDEAALTGESRWVRRARGDEVSQGTTCVEVSEGPLELEVSALGAQTRMGRLISEITTAQQSKAQSVQRADKLAAWLVTLVFLLSTLGALYWGFVEGSWEKAFDVVVSLCVITCPCALGLATPLALAVGRAKALEAGVLLRGSDVIERLAALEHLTLDKTGTLTTGALSVTSVVSLQRTSSRQLDLWGAIEQLEREARHPVAQALRRYASAHRAERGAGRGSEARLEGWEERVGEGVEATLMWAEGEQAHLKLGRVDEAHLSSAEALSAVQALVANGESPVGVWLNHELITLLGLSDPPREGLSETLSALRELGLSLSLRSGDHEALTQRLAERVGLEDARGRCSPQDKAHEVRSLVADGREVAMVGDGVNDALAFTEASIGIAVSGGAAVVIEAAQVYVQRGVEDLPTLIEGARRVMSLASLNVRFALVYNVIFASLALMGHVTPLIAAVLMPISSLTVVLTSALWTTFRAEV